MHEPDGCVLIIEENATRADLYDLWLAEFTVRIAVTKKQAVERFDDDVRLVVLQQEFADGAAEKLLSIFRAADSPCEVVTTTDNRSQVFPKLDVEHHLVKPIFREELVEKVERLVRQLNYTTALKEYYSITARLTTLEVGDHTDASRKKIYGKLKRRGVELRDRLHEYRAQMDEEDVSAVIGTVPTHLEPDVPTEDPPSVNREESATHSKYCPSKCSHCGQQWSQSGNDGPERKYTRLAAYVWRCRSCGHVQMHGDPSYQRVSRSG